MRLRLGPMKITFCCTDTKAEPWLQGLAAALPGAEISVWQPGAPQVDYAVVWAPPQQFMDEQPALKALFNIGAGVDALLKLRLPPKALVVRLDDAGMAVQMAEYVCHAVIRHFREFDGYEADTQAGRWGYRKPRLRSAIAAREQASCGKPQAPREDQRDGERLEDCVAHAPMALAIWYVASEAM